MCDPGSAGGDEEAAGASLAWRFPRPPVSTTGGVPQKRLQRKQQRQNPMEIAPLERRVYIYV